MTLEQLFENPPKEFSPAPFWWWSGERLDPKRLRWQMERLVEGGVTQAIVIQLAPDGPAYGVDADDPPWFTEAWWEIFLAVCADAKKLGFRLWFYDHLGFGCANAQEKMIAAHPEFVGWALELEAGKASIVRRGYDYLQPAAAAALIDAVHGEFARRAALYFGSVIVGSFQDQLTPLQAWSRDFAVEFRRCTGYDLEPRLAALWEDQADAARVRRDYQRVRAAMAEEAFFRPLHEWHQRHGLLSGCDQKGFSRRGYPIDCTTLYADYQRTHRWFRAPGSDHRGDTKIHSSLAHVYGRPRVWIEAFHSSGWGATLEETFDWLIPYLRAGANLFNPHAVYYSMRGGLFEWAPPSYCWRQPYWRHYPHFARAVSRLCAVLSQGDHVCDIAVLFPTSTVQAGLRLDGVSESARRAHEVYLEVVGQMVWEDPRPGVLDLDCRDFDVLDEESVERATIANGRLQITRESYRAIILPACAMLPDDVSKVLGEFSKAGGKVIAVENAKEVPAALADIERLVEAPVPTLRRRVDGRDMLLVPAAFPSATRHAHPEGLLAHRFHFDPSRYARTMRIVVREVKGEPHAWDPYTGRQRRIVYARQGEEMELQVDFRGEPLALIIWDSSPVPTLARSHAPQVRSLDGPWDVRLIPTSDRPVQCWQFEHRLDSDPEHDWNIVHATFGPHGWWRASDSKEWRPATYSLSHGIYKDPLHRNVYGPHGHVPEEFLDFGEVAAGQEIDFRTTIHAPEAMDVHLAIGAPAAKRAWLNSQDLGPDTPGYHWMVAASLRAGANELAFRLTAGEVVRLRAYYAFLKNAERFRRPEWISLDDDPRRGSLVRVRGGIEVPFRPRHARIRVAVGAACRVLLNGAETGSQQQWENAQGDDSIRTHETTSHLCAGRNEVAVEWTDPGHIVPVLVDALLQSHEGRSVSLITDGQWQASRDGRETGLRVRRKHGSLGAWWGPQVEPAWAHLWRRPHPLLDMETVARVQPDAFPGKHRVEWFRFRVPPGTIKVHAEVAGDAQMDLRDGICTLRVVPEPGHSGGAVFRQPVSFDAGPGTMELGDWTKLGLSAYSGGVSYSRTVRLESGRRIVLDLGNVRGTAEVFLNGRSAGVRVWSPYRFDITEFVSAGDNRIEIQVFNTLAPHLDAASPTPYVFPGQIESGLFGPVTISVFRQETQ